MNQYEAFIFDMDGTLINNMPFHIRSWLALFAEMGITFTEKEFHTRLSGKTNAETVQEVFGGQVTAEDIARIAHRKEVQYRSIYGPHLQPVAGLPEFLQRSRDAGLKTAVATSAGPDNIAFVLEGLGLMETFTAVVGAQDVQNGKPHPDIFLTAAQRLQVPPAACLVFEDSPAGIEAARRAGMDTVVVQTALSDVEAAAYPHVIAAAADYHALIPRLFPGLNKR